MNLPAHKYKAGDRVVQKGSGYGGTIRSASVYDSNNRPIYYIDFDHGWMGVDVIREDELELEPSKTASVYKSYEIKCECGAHATSFPDSHSLWCPKHRKD